MQAYDADLLKMQTCSGDTDRAFVFNAALFAYLQAHDVSAAAQVFQPILSFTSGSSEEQLFIAYAKILYRHSVNRALYRPGDLRNVLEQALNRFPKNSIFHQLYLFNVSTSFVCPNSVLTRVFLFRKLAHVYRTESGLLSTDTFSSMNLPLRYGSSAFTLNCTSMLGSTTLSPCTLCSKERQWHYDNSLPLPSGHFICSGR